MPRQTAAEYRPGRSPGMRRRHSGHLHRPPLEDCCHNRKHSNPIRTKSHIARTWVTIDWERELEVALRIAGAERSGSRRAPPPALPVSGSWAAVWSVTRSKCSPRATSSGNTSAAFPSSATDSGLPSAAAARTRETASSRDEACSSTIPRREPTVDRPLIDLDAENRRTGHRRRERLRPAHPAEAGSEHRPACEIGRAEVHLAGGAKRLVGALEDALGADVDPGSRRHLPEHRQPLGLEPAELVPGRPLRHEQRVRDQHARRALVRPEDAYRLAGLHEQRLVVTQPQKRPDDVPQGLVRSGRPPRAAVHDEVLGMLGDLGIEVVEQHPQRRLGLPRQRVQLGPRGARTAERSPQSASIRASSGSSVQLVRHPGLLSRSRFPSRRSLLCPTPAPPPAWLPGCRGLVAGADPPRNPHQVHAVAITKKIAAATIARSACPPVSDATITSSRDSGWRNTFRTGKVEKDTIRAASK